VIPRNLELGVRQWGNFDVSHRWWQYG
jgi:hypothetical protein